MRLAILLPNIITACNLFSGIAAITLGIQGRPLAAVYLVFLGMAFDYYDGKIARLTGTVSRFGTYVDSLADVITFGLAPVVLILLLCPGSRRAVIGVILLIYVLSGSFRLIRYSKNMQNKNTGAFTGLPIPAAAGMLMSYILIYLYTKSSFPYFIVGILLIVTSILMVSRLPYFHFASILQILPRSSKVLFFILILLFVLTGHGFAVLFVLFAIYCVFAIRWQNPKSS